MTRLRLCHANILSKFLVIAMAWHDKKNVTANAMREHGTWDLGQVILLLYSHSFLLYSLLVSTLLLPTEVFHSYTVGLCLSDGGHHIAPPLQMLSHKAPRHLVEVRKRGLLLFYF